MTLAHLVLFPVIFPIIPVIYPQISMTEINQGIFCTLFQTCKNFKIQLFPVISPVNCVIKFSIFPCLFLVVFTNNPKWFLWLKFGKLDRLNGSLHKGRSRKMTGKGTKWVRVKASYYNYCHSIWLSLSWTPPLSEHLEHLVVIILL